jgi:hypothetical protein
VIDIKWAQGYLAEQTRVRKRKAAIHAIVQRFQPHMSYAEAMEVWPHALGLTPSYHTEIATAWHTGKLLKDMNQ